MRTPTDLALVATNTLDERLNEIEEEMSVLSEPGVLASLDRERRQIELEIVRRGA